MENRKAILTNIKDWFKAFPENFKKFFKEDLKKWFKETFTKKNIIEFFRKDTVQTILTSIICALAGLFIGFIVLLIINPEHAFEGIISIIKGCFASQNPTRRARYFGETLTKTAPLLLCGLSILFAYKAGLFNIGAAGQFVVGAGASLYFALALNCPWYVCILAAMVAGAIWGCIAGVLKALLNVNEVISGIMLNWIGLYLTNLVIYGDECRDTILLSQTWSISKTTDASGNSIALLPQLGLDQLFGNCKYIGIGIFISLALAIVIEIVLKKTTFGYELMATGNNKNAAKYAGMKEQRNIIITLVISGALAGLSAATLYLTDIVPWYFPSSVPSMGFDGISTAFLGGLSPIGTIFSSFFIQFINDGKDNIDTRYFTAETTALITSLIIYLCAFVMFVKTYMSKKLKNAAKKLEEDTKPLGK